MGIFEQTNLSLTCIQELSHNSRWPPTLFKCVDFLHIYVGRLTDENDFPVSSRVPFHFPSPGLHFWIGSAVRSVHSTVQLM